MEATQRTARQAPPRSARGTSPRNRASAVEQPATRWQDRPLITIKLASEVSGVSPTSIYRLAHEGKLVLRRLAGRVLVETAGLIETIAAADLWTPSDHGRAGREKNAELTRSAWRR